MLDKLFNKSCTESEDCDILDADEKISVSDVILELINIFMYVLVGTSLLVASLGSASIWGYLWLICSLE